jgi:copper chaperone
MTNKTYKVNGMSCMHCVKHVKEAIEDLDGVKSCVVSLEKGNMAVEYDETKTGLEAMKEALEEAGYDLEER